MLEIENNVIKLSRGDSAYIDIVIKNPTNPHQIYLPRNGERIIFSLFRNVTSPTPIFERDFVNGVLQIMPQDTIDLEYSDYMYTVSLQFLNNDLNTIIEPTVFRLKGSGNRGTTEIVGENSRFISPKNRAISTNRKITNEYYAFTPPTSTNDYRVNSHLSGRLKGYLNNATVYQDSRVIGFNDQSEFPENGKENIVYIDKTNDAAFRWDSDINQYVPLNTGDKVKVFMAHNLVMSETAPDDLGSLWVDMSDNFFLKYYDGVLWRKSNIALLVDPHTINNDKWVIIPDPEEEEEDEDTPIEQDPSRWMIIPDD